MNKRRLGRSNIEVAPLMFGGNVFGWTIDEPISFQILDAFVDAGFNFIDTADVYARWVPGNHGGESETILGNWFKHSGKRDKVVLATKVGMEMGPGKVGLSKARIKEAVDESLKRLQTDRIDLYQAHKDDPNTPLEETLEAFSELVKEGKARVIGASNYSADRLAQALEISRTNGLSRYESLQPEYNLCERARYESELEPICRAENLAVIPYYSLAGGFLSGKYRSEADLANRARAKNVKKYVGERGFRILSALDEVSARHKTKPACVAIAWLLARPSITAPICSATSLKQLEDLFAALRLELSASDVETLNTASASA